MRKMLLSGAVLAVLLAAVPAAAQRRARPARTATFAVHVTDSSGAAVRNVLITVTGPVTRSARAAVGRLAFENLPVGTYRLRFERDGFAPLEQTVTARAGAPIEVNVTMTRPGEKPTVEAPAAASATPPPVHASAPAPVVLDLPSFIEKNYVGSKGGKSDEIACGTGGTATLIQINEPIREHVHADADEFIYVIAGQGVVRVANRAESLSAGVFVLLPRGTPHAFAASGRSPLVMMSTRAGAPCVAATR
jgi:mannose-6-phosphate isomerase-like protein (cupin superfamily)